MEHRLNNIVEDIHTGRRKPHGLEICDGPRGIRELQLEFYSVPNYVLIKELVSFSDILPELLAKVSQIRYATKAFLRQEAECPICLEEYKCRQRVRKLPCGHEFHGRCFDKWCYKSGGLTCPVCRANHMMSAFRDFLAKTTYMEDYVFTSQEPVTTVRLKRLDSRETQKPYEADKNIFISTWLRPITVATNLQASSQLQQEETLLVEIR